MIKANLVSAIVWKEPRWFVAQAFGVNVASQGKTKQEAINNLQEALELYFEDEPSTSPLLSFLPQDPYLTKIAINA